LAITKSGPQLLISDAYLALASDIVRNSESQEAALRTAISRAYYSVYLTVRDRLFGCDGVGLTNNVKKKLEKRIKQRGLSTGSHANVISAVALLPAKGITTPMTLSQQIDELQDARIHADYNFGIDKLKDVPYNTWLEYSEKMVALASQLLPATKRLPSFDLDMFML